LENLPIKTLLAIISGRVQGVFYRAWTIEKAHTFGLAGWVRNLSDGSVEAVFQGEDKAVDAMIDACKTGPREAVVQTVQTYPWPIIDCHSFSQHPSA
jgi:acylphosphatase